MHLLSNAISDIDRGPLTWVIVCALASAIGLWLLGTKGAILKILGIIAFFSGISGLLTIFGFFDNPSIAWFVLALLLAIVSALQIGPCWESSKFAAMTFAVLAFVGGLVVYLTIDNIVELPTGTVGEVFEQGIERFRTLLGIADDGLKQRL